MINTIVVIIDVFVASDHFLEELSVLSQVVQLTLPSFKLVLLFIYAAS